MKAGNSNIRLYGDGRYAAGGGPIDVQLKSNIIEPKIQQSGCEQKECPTVEKDFIKDNALMLIIVSFVVGLILMAIIFLPILSKAKKKNVESSVAPVNTPSSEAPVEEKSDNNQ